MAGITLAQAEAKLAVWLAAEEACAGKQSYRIEEEGSSRQLTYADLAEIGKRVAYWNSKVIALSRAASGTSRMRSIVN